jgi:Acyl-protein synthetase, LuxE
MADSIVPEKRPSDRDPTSAAETESDALHEAVQAWAREWQAQGSPWQHDETRFKELAKQILQFQYMYHARYARLCRSHGVALAELDVNSAPAVPSDAFRFAHLGTFRQAQMPHVFRTSGTTSGARGEHRFRRLDTYHACALATAKAAFGMTAPPALVVGPSARELSDSSLTHMNALFARAFAAREHTLPEPFCVQRGRIDSEVFATALERAKNQPMLLLGTSLAMMELMRAMPPKPLPKGSVLMHTGGFKAKHVTMNAAELRQEIASFFALPLASVVAEYGMTELSSQFYERSATGAPMDVLYEPPWARVVPVDPETLRPVAEGQVGIARIVDLANIDSVCIVQTQDRVVRAKGGFVLLGRLPGATPRGCALSIEELLAGGAVAEPSPDDVGAQ